MSQLNVDVIKHSGGSGPGLEFLSNGNFAFDTDGPCMLTLLMVE